MLTDSYIPEAVNGCEFLNLVIFFQAGHLKMLGGYIEFFMDPTLADCYIKLKEELEILLQKKVNFPGPCSLFSAFYS